jgi:hypothetical protein
LNNFKAESKYEENNTYYTHLQKSDLKQLCHYQTHYHTSVLNLQRNSLFNTILTYII